MSSVFDHVPAKTSFLAGLVAGVLGCATVGFIVLLVMFLRGGGPLAARAGSGSVAQANTAQPSAAAAAPSAGQAPSGQVRKADSNDHVRGSLSKAKVTLIEYSDYECPFCKRFHPSMQQIMKDYGDKVAWVYRNFPLSFHANAEKEAEAAECAGELGGNNAYWQYGDTLFERTAGNGTGFALDKLVPLAKELGLNENKFKSCLDSGKYADKVRRDSAEGSAAGVNGTPSTFVVSKSGQTQLIPGALPTESVKQVIDQLLKG